MRDVMFSREAKDFVRMSQSITSLKVMYSTNEADEDSEEEREHNRRFNLE